MHQHLFKVQSADISEYIEIYRAVTCALTLAHPVTIYFDCAGAGFSAAGLASPSAEARTIALATKALVHYVEAHGVKTNFIFVHSRKGHGLNESVDNIAKAGADCLHCSWLPCLSDQG